MKKSVLKATVLVFALSLVAKIIGFIKSIIQAAYFGTTALTDAYNIANGFVSNVLYMLATALAVAFVPMYIQKKQQQLEKQFSTRIITLLCFGSVLLSGILILLTPLIVKVIAPGYIGDEQRITIQYFRVLVIGFTFALTTHLYTSLLNAERVYGFSAACSIINSVVLIVSIVLFSKTLGVWALVISMPISYMIQWLALYLRGKKYARISLKYGLWDKDIQLLSIQAFPILISQATVEINQVVDRALLTSIGTGALTAVSYSMVLYQFVTTLVSTPLSTVMFTELSEAGAKKDDDEIKKILHNSYRVLFLVCIPIIAVIFFIPENIVRIVYGYGKFSDEAIMQCAVGLKMYGLCLLPVCIKSVLNKAYYAVNNTKTPMIIGIFEVALNICLSILLVRKYGIIGVVGATAIASFVFIIVMLIDYNRKYIAVIRKETILSYWKLVLSTAILILIMVITKGIVFQNKIVLFLFKSVLAFSAYYLVLLILKEETLYLITTKAICLVRKKIKE